MFAVNEKEKVFEALVTLIARTVRDEPLEAKRHCEWAIALGEEIEHDYAAACAIMDSCGGSDFSQRIQTNKIRTILSELRGEK